MIHPRISRREWYRVIAFAGAILLITTLPYVIGAAAQTAHHQFGWLMFGVDDGNSYFAKMREGAVDGWLFHIVYTSEPHEGAVLFTPYLAAGKIAGWIVPPSDPAFVDAMIVVFHVSRLLCDLLLVLVIYRFIAIFLIAPRLRFFTLILVMLGGGLGWLLVIVGQGNWLGSLPVDLSLPEGYSFYVLYGLPHVALARACMFGGFMLIFEALRVPSTRRWLGLCLAAGVLWLIMGLCVPFYIAVLYLILGVWGLAALLRHRRFPIPLFIRCVIGAIIPLPYLLYNFYVFATNPVLGQWSAQNVLPSPNPLHYVLGYGVLAVLTLPALRWAWSRGKHTTAYLLLPAWVVAAPIFAYLPINVQRRLLEGIFVPLCILAVMGLRLWWIGSGVRHFPRRAKRVWSQAEIGLLALTLPTTLVIVMSGIQATQDMNNRLFHTDDEIAMLDWLNVHAVPDSVVLCSFNVGNYLPVRTSLRAFIGHGPETLNLEAKSQQANRFFSGQMPLTDQRTLLAANRIRYVIYTTDQPTPNDPDLTRVYQSASYVVYATSPAG